MTQESASTAPETLLLGRYRIREKQGDGRLATVYHATDERLHRDVLLHVMHKELVEREPLRQRFLAEINTYAQRPHPLLLEVYDSGEAGGRPYMVTEYVQGRPLHQHGMLQVEHALLYTRQVAGAVAACLAQNLPYPPVCSSNVLVVGEGHVKLVDSWLRPQAESAREMACYRAPELTEGKPPGETSVVYSLGLLLYELLTGARPVQGEDAQAVAQAHLNLHLTPLSFDRPMLSLPMLEKLITRATARYPTDRLPNARAFEEEIDAIWRNHTTNTQRFAVPARPRSPQPRTSRLRPEQAAAPSPSPSPPPSPSPYRPAPAPAPAPYSPADDESLRPLDADARRRKSLVRGLTGWVVMLLLLLFIALGSYALASYAVEQFFAIELPQPTLPDLGWEWPEWLGGGEEGEVLVVNISSNEGLNLRDEPGISTNVIATIPSGTIVHKLDGPQVVDDVEWVYVRTETTDGEPIEGWMSFNFLKKPPE